LLVGEGEVALVFLGEVEDEHGVEPVEGAAELEEVLVVRGLGVDLVEEGADALRQVGDLGVAAAHGGGGVGAAEDAGEDRVEDAVFGSFVWCDVANEEPVDVASGS
jgi:hypothetical protein